MAELNFQNTEVAFASKSNAQLKRSYQLFKLMNSKKAVKFGSFAASMGLRIGLPIKWLIKETIYKQFCGGEDIVHCRKTIDNLYEYGVGAILDYSIEGREDEKEFDATAEEIISTLREAKNNDAIPFSVFKPSGLLKNSILEKLSLRNELSPEEAKLWQRGRERIDKICSLAHQIDQAIFIDAEESWIQDPIDEVVEEMMEKYNRVKPLVYNTVQLYRKDRLDYTMKLCERANQKGFKAALKLVRGAYMEKERERAIEKGYPSPIQDNKDDTDRDYDDCLTFLMQRNEQTGICAGSHNEESCRLLTTLIEEKGRDKKDPNLNFSQLLGMSDHLSFNLAKAGFNVTKYVPYGPVKDVLPYLVRRAEENSSISGQMSRELALLKKELRRRRSN